MLIGVTVIQTAETAKASNLTSCRHRFPIADREQELRIAETMWEQTGLFRQLESASDERTSAAVCIRLWTLPSINSASKSVPARLA